MSVRKLCLTLQKLVAKVYKFKAPNIRINKFYLVMKKLVFSIVALCVGAFAMAQRSFYIYYSDGTYEKKSVAKIDSISFTGPSKEPYFSVSDETNVLFSSGNLHYTQSTDTWNFAANQYDTLGVAAVVGNSAFAGKIELFGWSANNTTAPWGISTSTNDDDYSGNFVDWGENIGDGTTWRTLTSAEWDYLFFTRENAANLVGFGSVNGVNGLFILPDNWKCPERIEFNSVSQKGLELVQNENLTEGKVGSSYHNSNRDNFSHNSFLLAEWQLMEQAGAVFLPATGYRGGSAVYGVQYRANYWSSTPHDDSLVKSVDFSSERLSLQSGDRHYGGSVRLVKEIK